MDAQDLSPHAEPADVDLHDAFVSYSRVDKAFAAELEKALESCSLPKALRSRRRLDVFRDENDFTGTEYHEALSRHLTRSRALLVVCSPAARGSQFVAEEIEVFARARGAGAIIPVLVRGVPNNELRSGQEGDAAFPDALVAALRMPLAVDYRSFTVGKHKFTKGAYEGSWFSLLANLLGVARSEVEQREKKRQARVRNFWVAGLGVVSSLLLSLSVWALAERSTAGLERDEAARQRDEAAKQRDAAATQRDEAGRQRDEAARRRDEAAQQRDVAARQRDEALRSQSQFLAQLSHQQTGLGQYDLGIKVALLALPRRLDTPDRPYVSAAEVALYAAFAQQSFRFVLGGARGGGETLGDARINADGSRAVLDYGSFAELWDLGTGELLSTLKGEGASYVDEVAFAPDGRTLVVGHSGLGRLVTVDPATGEPVLRGSMFDVFDARSGSAIGRIEVPGGLRGQMQFSPSGKRLLIATDEQFRMFDTSSWRPVLAGVWRDIKWPVAPPFKTIAISDDERKVAFVGESGVAAVVDVAERAFLGTVRRDQVLTARFVGAGALAIQAASGIAIVRTATFAETALPMRQPSRIVALGYDGGRTTVVAVTEDARALSWPLGEEQTDVDAKSSGLRIRTASLDHSGTRAIIEFEDGSLEAWTIPNATRRPVLASQKERQLLRASFVRDADTALLATSDGFARVWQRSTPAAVDRSMLTYISGATASVFRSRGDGELAIGTRSGDIVLGDASSDRKIGSLSAGYRGPVTCLAFDATGRRLVSGGPDGSAVITDVTSHQRLFRVEGHSKAVDFCAFSPDGTSMVTGSSDATFRLWDARSGRLRSVLPVPARYLSNIYNASVHPQAAFTSDSKLLLTVTAGDRMNVGQPALIWDVATGALRQALSHMPAAILDVAITPDDRYVVTTSYDMSSAVWDIQSGKRIHTFAGHSTPVVSGVVIDKGRALATASLDGHVEISQIDTGLRIHQWNGGINPHNLQISHDGRLLAVGSTVSESRSIVEIRDPSSGLRLLTIDVPGGLPLNSLAFSRDDRQLITRTATGQLWTWRLPPTGQDLIERAWARVARPGQALLTHEQRVRFALDSR